MYCSLTVGLHDCVKRSCYLVQNALMELTESTVNGRVTAECLVKHAINQQENVRPVADLVSMVVAVRFVSALNS